MVIAFGNTTGNHTTGWKSEPSGRGTWDILSSCVITIGLCAWTALHLNVPEHKTSKWQWIRKVKWLILGLVAPEMVAYVAWRQRQEAKAVLRDVKSHLGQPMSQWKLARMFKSCFRAPAKDTCSIESCPSSPGMTHMDRPNWTLVHGFYAVMGGFAMDCSGSDDAFLTDDRTRAAITPEGLRFVLDHEPDLLPDILEDQIRDKSKADGLKKTLVCVQAVWFCASCVTRLANRMPISLLELNAMAHAACALLIYLMWWHKPLDVDEPTLLEGFKSDALCAFMWMASRVGARGTKNCDIHGRFLDEFDALWMYRLPDYKDLVFGEEGMLGSVQGLRDRPSGDPNAPGSGPGELSNSLVKSQDNVLDSSIYPRYYRRYSPSDIRYRKWIWFKKHLPCSRLNLPAGMGVRKTAIDHLSLATITRWRLAYRAITQYHLEDFVRKRLHTRSQLYDDGSLLNTRVPNFVSFIGSSFHEVWFGLSIAGVLYGGLHMLAWDAPFSSRVEQIFWRISASSVTLTPLVLAPVMLLPEIGGLSQSALSIMRRFQRRNIEDEGEGKVTDRAAQWAKTVFVGFLIPLLFLGPFFWLLYVTARVFLVVECFKNVAYLPEGVFEDVGWPGYLPHVT